MEVGSMYIKDNAIARYEGEHILKWKIKFGEEKYLGQFLEFRVKSLIVLLPNKEYETGDRVYYDFQEWQLWK